MEIWVLAHYGDMFMSEPGNKVKHTITIENGTDSSFIQISESDRDMIHITQQFTKGIDTPNGIIIMTKGEAELLAITLKEYIRRIKKTGSNV